MSQEERYGERDGSYSAWHRRGSTSRFFDDMYVRHLSMIDIDAAVYLEFNDANKEPIALFEVCRDVGQPGKATTVITALAKRTNPVVRAYLVMYKHGTTPNPIMDPENWTTG